MSEHTWFDDGPAPEGEVQSLTTFPGHTVTAHLGTGGTSYVVKAFETELQRDVAIKLLRPEAEHHRSYFRREAEITAKLAHPSIPSVYQRGESSGGMPFFTMQVIRGDPLSSRLHGLALRPALRYLCTACDALGYAHSQQVVHRDVKPENLVIGDHGTLFVVDWGLATASGYPLRGVSGTPAYLAPEQAIADGSPVRPQADVYALGAILFELLYGEPLRPEADALAQARANQVDWPAVPADPALVDLCRQCLSTRVEDRPRDAGVVADALRRWLDGEAQQERANTWVQDSLARLQRAHEVQGQSEVQLAEATRLLAEVPDTASESEKMPAWNCRRAGEQLALESVEIRAEAESRLQSALSLVPGHADAHGALLDLYTQDHRRAESSGHLLEATRIAQQMRRHLESLPDEDPCRQRASSYLNPRAEVHFPSGHRGQLQSYVAHFGRLDLGPSTPLRSGRVLEQGRYRITLTSPSGVRTVHPVWVSRDAPVRFDLHPIDRPCHPDACWVPGGPFAAGGDPRFPSYPRRWVHVDAFAIQIHPVTVRDYLGFLNALVDAGEVDRALSVAPRSRPTTPEDPGTLLVARDDAGRFFLAPDGEGDVWDLDWPVLYVDWTAAVTYADWYAAQTGLPWRLPCELEWEKAARGVDGRIYPWGDGFDPTWACTRRSHVDRPLPAVVHAFPVDESPYGARQMAGNVQEWCGDTWSPSPQVDEGRAVIVHDAPDAARPDVWRHARGGQFVGSEVNARIAGRLAEAPTNRSAYAGFRLCYSVVP